MKIKGFRGCSQAASRCILIAVMRLTRLPSVLVSLSFIMASFVLGLALPTPALAACDPATDQKVSIGFPGAVKKGDEFCVPLNKSSTNIQDNPIFTLLKGILQFMAAGVGLAVVGGIIWGGYLFLTARGNSGQVEKGIEAIRNAIIALFLFLFMFAILNFLIPGGILS